MYNSGAFVLLFFCFFFCFFFLVLFVCTVIFSLMLIVWVDAMSEWLELECFPMCWACVSAF